jgi:enoyl-CoA hydratase/carnithine racemase
MQLDSRVVISETLNGIATLTIHRPESMNALDAEVVSRFADSFHAAASDPEVEGIVIASSGKTFVVGADVRFFLRYLEARELEPIVEFTKSAHALFNAIDDCPLPVVARVHGPAIGGGVELALACDHIVATPAATFAFPETGIGIYPGLGGTQRTPRRIGVGMAKALVFTGRELDADEARVIGLVDLVVSEQSLDRSVRTLIENGLPTPEAGVLRGDASVLARFFEHHSVEDVRTGRVDTGGSAVLERAVRQVRRGAPLALRIAERLIDDGLDRPLHEGLHLEIEHVVEIFSTADAVAGLTALGRRKLEFEGR